MEKYETTGGNEFAIVSSPPEIEIVVDNGHGQDVYVTLTHFDLEAMMKLLDAED